MNKLTFIALLIPLLASCGSVSLSQSDRDYTQIHPAPKAFDSKRTEYTCTTWTPPSPPDAESHLWYRAATLLDAKDWRMNKQEFQDMIVLYEAAASKGALSGNQQPLPALHPCARFDRHHVQPLAQPRPQMAALRSGQKLGDGKLLAV